MWLSADDFSANVHVCSDFRDERLSIHKAKRHAGVLLFCVNNYKTYRLWIIEFHITGAYTKYTRISRFVAMATFVNEIFQCFWLCENESFHWVTSMQLPSYCLRIKWFGEAAAWMWNKPTQHITDQHSVYKALFNNISHFHNSHVMQI